MDTRRLARTLGDSLRRAARAYWRAYAETSWLLRYGPGYAPTAPVRFSGAPAAGAAPAYRLAPAPMPAVAADAAPAGVPLGAAPQPPSGFRRPGRPGRPTPAMRSPAHPAAETRAAA